MKYQKNVLKNIQKHIRHSDREITILFTDMVASVQYWNSRGDVRGRLLIDLQNRLVFPIIRRNRGKLVKTIGDSLMIRFKKPHHAVCAAIAIQQSLRREREERPDFPPVRIGIHTGRAIVERGDVFGDMINTASRIVDKAKGDEILLSSNTSRGMGLRRKNLCPLEKKARFTPKGKKQELTVYACRWKKAPDHAKGSGRGSSLLMDQRQRWIALGAVLASALMVVLLFLRYVRYWAADHENLALFFLNPWRTISAKPVLGLIAAGVLIAVVLLLVTMKRISLFLYRCLYGVLGFCVLFFLFEAVRVIKPDIGSSRVLYTSKHLFVEILADRAQIREEPSRNSAVVQTVPRGMLLLLNDVEERGDLVWNRVLLGPGRYGFVQRVEPPQMGVLEKRISFADKFRFSLRDVIQLAFGGVGFIIGFLRFKIRPA